MGDRSISLLYFAWIRERVGLSGETVDLPPEVATVGALVVWLRGRGSNYEAAFATPARGALCCQPGFCDRRRTGEAW